MTNKEIREVAKAEGFAAAITSPDRIIIKPEFRSYCEENLCGKYGVNYACPPDCGAVDVLQRKLLDQANILVVQTIWPIDDYNDKAAIEHARDSHNKMILNLKAKLDADGHSGFCLGYNGCPICSPCKKVLNQPCPHPDKRISCMSAYCINVAELAKHCDLSFDWSSDKLYLFGMIAYR